MENNPRFGEIIYANLPYSGSVQGGIRPVLVVQNDVGNRHAPTVEVIPLSSRINKGHHIISFSKRWNVCCIVVLHPKKMDMNRRMSLYDLSGVSASINLSHRVLSLYRVSKKDKQGVRKQNGDWLTKPIDYDVIIDILKDRYGSGGGRDVGLFYDIPSKRFYDSTETLAYQYKWDTMDHSFEDIPFGLSTPDRIHYEENREVFGTIPSGC